MPAAVGRGSSSCRAGSRRRLASARRRSRRGRGRCPARSGAPIVISMPAASRLSLTVNGTPCSGPAGSRRCVGLARPRERALGVDLDDGVDARVHLLDPPQVRLDDLDRGPLARADRVGKLATDIGRILSRDALRPRTARGRGAGPGHGHGRSVHAPPGITELEYVLDHAGQPTTCIESFPVFLVTDAARGAALGAPERQRSSRRRRDPATTPSSCSATPRTSRTSRLNVGDGQDVWIDDALLLCVSERADGGPARVRPPPLRRLTASRSS